MPELEPLILSYTHLGRLGRAAEALIVLKKVASLVKPIMREHGWKVRELAEFYPNEQNLLGLNVNRGMKVCLRLRHASDQNQFLPMESVVDTMLHELCHIVHGPHDSKFHALWDQLRDKWQALLFKGYTGEGFLTEGRRLGGTSLPTHEVQRITRATTAVKQTSQQSSGLGIGQRLGGAGPSRPPRPGRNLRQAAAAAAGKRNKALEGCATEKLSRSEIRDIADTATRNGFRTRAEEDEANDLAIAQALWEMAQEDEMIKNSDSHMAPAPAEKGMGVGGRPVNTTASSDMPPASRGSQSNERPVWVCSVCTLHNPPSFLCCDACGGERTEAKAPLPKAAKKQESRPAVVDLTGSPPKKKKRQETLQDRRPPPPPQTWRCEVCNTEMERQWWTCSTCGRMKTDSR